MIERLFVYGTLQPGGPNEHILADIGGEWVPGKVKGHLKEFGWGAAYNYPGLILDDEGYDVDGFVFSSANLNAQWRILDDFEGSEYQRVTTSIELASGKQIEANIYVLDLSKAD